MSDPIKEASTSGWIAEHREQYLKDGNAGHMWDPAQVGGPPGALPTLLLTTIGRKSGTESVMPLLYGDVEGGYAIIASKGSESGIAPWYVKRVEEYLELHAGRDIRIRDMTAIAGVSERTLYNGFRVWRATSPKSYLKAVRLDRVRTELLGLKAKSRSVSEIAREAGFRHMGNFARDYGKRFGERPSDTLRYRITTNE